MKTVIIDNFNAGIANDPRADGGVARMISNFDVLTNPKKMTPYHDSESGDGAASTSKKQNFAIALRSGSYRLFSLGVVSGTARAEVLFKDLTTGGTSDLSDSGWNTPSNNQSSTGSTNFELFVYYQKTGLIYGARAGTQIWAFDPSSGTGWADSSHSLSYTNLAQGLVHSKDDILYIPYDNKIAKNSNGSWTDAALTLPTNLYITSICEYGDYLAIACAPLSGVGMSRVFLWNRDESVTTISESIAWSDGSIKILHAISGRLIGLTLYGNSTRFADRVLVHVYDGTTAQQIAVLEGSTTTQLPIAKQLIDNRLWFMMSITLNGAVRSGVWSIGPRPDGTYSLIHERTPNNDTAFAVTDTLKYFFKVGDYLFQSYIDNGSNALTKTNDATSYTATAIYETKINPGMPLADTFKRKKLKSVAVFTEPLSGSAQVVAKYKVDGGSYTTIKTHTTSTLASMGKSDLIGLEVPDNGQLTEGREFEFRLESTGGAVITGYAYTYDDKIKSPLFV